MIVVSMNKDLKVGFIEQENPEYEEEDDDYESRSGQDIWSAHISSPIFIVYQSCCEEMLKTKFYKALYHEFPYRASVGVEEILWEIWIKHKQNPEESFTEKEIIHELHRNFRKEERVDRAIEKAHEDFEVFCDVIYRFLFDAKIREKALASYNMGDLLRLQLHKLKRNLWSLIKPLKRNNYALLEEDELVLCSRIIKECELEFKKKST